MVLAALAALACVLPVGAAQAAGVGQVTSPAADAAVAEPTAIVAEVTGRTQRTSLFEPAPPHQVQVRLAAPTGDEPLEGTEPVDMTCETDCNSSSTWTAPDFDPATLAPFADTASCNGGYTIQVRVDGGAWTGHGVRVVREPAAPRDVRASADVGEATVSWKPAADPDVAGYRVQRRDGGSWNTVATRPASARSLADTDVSPGEVEYRVLTLKGDGRVDGETVAPCADTEPDLSTASAAVRTTVPKPPSQAASTPSSDPSGTPTRPDAPSDGDGSASPTDRPDATDGDGATEDAGEAAPGDPDDDPDGADEAQPAPRRSSRRVAPPTAVDVGSRPDVTVADVPGTDNPRVADERETYYGDGEEFSEELDFDGLGEVQAAPPTVETRTVRVPGALQGVLGEELDARRLALPIAGGLIMVALALHLRRWMRAGVES